MPRIQHSFLRATCALLLWLGASGLWAADPCLIEVVEKGSGWPVPLVQLRTVNQVRFVSDNAGRIAFDLPELMGREIWFEVIGHSYEVPKDGFGYRGVRLRPIPGGKLRVEVTRTLPAKRLGRITGSGLFGESQKLGLEPRGDESGVMGCDSIQNARYRGRLFWVWGDTLVPGYPLGIFDCSGATTSLQPLERFQPPIRLPYHYFTNASGAPRGVAPMKGEGPTWLSGLVTVPDENGQEQLVASFVKVQGFLDVYQRGLCVWNDRQGVFDPVRVLWNKGEGQPTPAVPLIPEGHAVTWRDSAGRAWILMGNPFPTFRCPATFEAWKDPSTWQAISPPTRLSSAADGTAVVPHSGGMAWNSFRKRWVAVFLQSAGKPSSHGELWYAEAPEPTGPWGSAVKIVSHSNYTFYNPSLHPEFTPEGSPILLFEGTYTELFANHAIPTARHDYNQILYRLDLDDPALAPARSANAAGQPDARQ